MAYTLILLRLNFNTQFYKIYELLLTDIFLLLFYWNYPSIFDNLLEKSNLTIIKINKYR